MGRPATGVIGAGSGRPSTSAIRLLAGMREPCRLASTENIDILTGGLVEVDGVTPVAGDRILLKNQTDDTENGIYTTAAGPWYRAADARSPRSITKGVQVKIQEGSTNTLTQWEFRTIKPDIGDDDIVIASVPLGGGGGGGAAILDMLTLGGTANALTATFDPAFTGHDAGQLLRIRTTAANTNNVTLDPDSFGAVSVRMPDGSQIPSGGIQANTDYLLRDDGTNFRIFLSNITF